MQSPVMNKNYPYKVWLTSISIAPLLLIVLFAALEGQGFAALSLLYLYFVFFGAIFSLPTLFIFYLASREFFNTSLSNISKKALLSLTAIVAMCFTFYIIGGKNAFTTEGDDGIIIPASYALSIIVSTFMYKLQEG
jgi:hypothetical protein